MDISNNKIIIFLDGYKFDVTEYASRHPGGKKILQKYNNKDATEIFNEVKGHSECYVLYFLDKFCIGKVDENE